MKLKIFLLLLITLNSNPVHDLQMTVFSFVKKDSMITLSVTFDKDDVLNLIANNEEFNLDQTSKYLLDNLSTQINNKWMKWEFCNYIIKEETIIIESNSIYLPDKIESFKMKNTNFISEIEKQINLIHIHINDTKRSFRMDKDRQRIEAFY